ncbi:MAG: ankyrin repeat domain-containing protein [Nitrospirales bacterium]|nr:ankyrin repeat domain-containing protein [Nitrospirales bacterium]
MAWAASLLFKTAAEGDLLLIQRLIAEGGDIEEVDLMSGFTPLHVAVIRNQKDVVDWLLAEGANIEARDSRGETPLHLATNKLNVPMMNLLLLKGANVNSQSQMGLTPLHLAVTDGRPESLDVAKILLEKGADRDLKDSFGRTPIDWVSDSSLWINRKMYDLLSKWPDNESLSIK